MARVSSYGRVEEKNYETLRMLSIQKRLWALCVIFGSLLTVAAAQPTQQEVLAQKDLMEFLANTRFSEQELAVMVNEMVEDAQKDPATYRASVKDTDEVRAAARQLQDPLKLGLLRQMLLGQYYAYHLQGHRSATLELVLTKVQPLAWDAKRQLILTTADLHGLLGYLSFQNQRLGGPGIGQAERSELARQFVQGFSQLTDEQMGLVCSGALVWQTVAANWQRLSQQQQAGWAQQSVSQGGGYNPSGGGQIDPHSYQKLSRMMLESHATNMNIIENMGGSGDYWEVRDGSW